MSITNNAAVFQISNEQLVARIKAGIDEAENMLELWQQNKGFIYKMAMKFQGYAEIEDLLQEGYLGLCEAVRHYKHGDALFITYAAFWIKQFMQRYIYDCCSNIRVPVYARDEIQRYKKIVSEFRKWYGKEPTDREMRAFLGVSCEKLDIIKQNALTVKTRSLSEPIGGEDENILLSDTIAADQDMEEDIIKRLDTATMQESLWKVVDSLDNDMAAVIRRRYQDKMTLKEVGQILGVSVERARQVENKALRKLRIPSKCAPFKTYFDLYLAAGPIIHIGVGTFNRTWTSSTELEALKHYEHVMFSQDK